MEEKSSRAVIIEAVRRDSALDIPHTLMNVLAASIASYGLLADSTAVVIGAMIVPMLLNPILGVWLMGFRTITRISKSLPSFLVRNGLSIILVFTLAAVFLINFNSVFSWQLFETRTRGILKKPYDDTRIISCRRSF